MIVATSNGRLKKQTKKEMIIMSLQQASRSAFLQRIEGLSFCWSVRNSRDSLVVRTSRCGRDNPGSNPGHGRLFFFFFKGGCLFV